MVKDPLYTPPGPPVAPIDRLPRIEKLLARLVTIGVALLVVAVVIAFQLSGLRADVQYLRVNTTSDYSSGLIADGATTDICRLLGEIARKNGVLVTDLTTTEVTDCVTAATGSP